MYYLESSSSNLEQQQKNSLECHRSSYNIFSRHIIRYTGRRVAV